MPELSASIAKYYHERTKYDPETLASKNNTLDWEKQPSPFKEYKIGNVVDLRPYLSEEIKNSTDRSTRDWQRLSRLLLLSYGLTAKIPTVSGSPIYLRTAPSAGGLYPAEVYLISKGTALLPAGIYNYQPLNHTLINFWENEVWSELKHACFSHSSLDETEIVMVTSAVFYRSAWRYQDRAYRRIFLDTGHLLGNIDLACALTDYRPYIFGGFRDREMDLLLYLDPTREGVLSVIALADLLTREPKTTKSRSTLASEVHSDYPILPDGELLMYFHQATQLERLSPSSSTGMEAEFSLKDKYNFPFCLKIPVQTTPIDWGENLSGLSSTILKRRSTRAYTGENLSLEELKSILNFTYQPQNYIAQNLDGSPDYFDLDLIETFIAVSGVTGLEEGCYYYAPKAQELRQIRFKNFRRELYFLCLGQELGRDAGAIVFHTADLGTAVAKYGDRVYRYLHLDAGHLGQRLNLAAIRLGLGVSGIGGFFDDRVNEVLGIPEDEAVIYITTLGRPR